MKIASSSSIISSRLSSVRTSSKVKGIKAFPGRTLKRIDDELGRGNQPSETPNLGAGGLLFTR